MHRPFLVTVLFALPVMTTPMRAQQRGSNLIGWIKDSSGTPVSGADVRIEAQQATARTDSSGRFSLTSLQPGQVTVRIRRLGFEQHIFDVTLRPNGVDSVAVTMDVSATVLDAMRTDAVTQQRHQALQGFYARRARGGGGYFITREDIEQHHTNVLSDALREVPGLRLPRTTSARGGGARFNSSNSKAYACPPQIWLDGFRVRNAEIDDFPATDIEGVELYFGPATTPTQFAPPASMASCGTIVIWSRIPGTA